MRARRQPSVARIDASASPIAGASAIASGFEIVARRAAMAATSRGRSSARIDRGMRRGRPRLPVERERPEHRRGRDRHAGVHEHGEKRRQAQARAQHLSGAGHHAGARLKANRHVGAGVPRRRQDRRIVERQAVEAGEEPQRRGGIRRAAAEAGRDRQALRQMEGARAQARDAPRERAGRLEDEVVRLGRRRHSPSGRRRTGSARPGSRLSSSPVPAKATRLSSS